MEQQKAPAHFAQENNQNQTKTNQSKQKTPKKQKMPWMPYIFREHCMSLFILIKSSQV